MTCQTLLAATSMTIASALGFSRQYRSAHFIQQCLFRHMRRYLLVLEVRAPALRFLGAIPRLRAHWRALTRPTAEIFSHPLTGKLLLDVQVSRQQVRKLGTVEACLDAVLDESNWIEPTSARSDETSSQREWCLIEARARLKQQAIWQRYALTWGSARVYRGQPHSFYRQRKARSIKRRQVKKLVRATQHRFWP